MTWYTDCRKLHITWSITWICNVSHDQSHDSAMYHMISHMTLQCITWLISYMTQSPGVWGEASWWAAADQEFPVLSVWGIPPWDQSPGMLPVCGCSSWLLVGRALQQGMSVLPVCYKMAFCILQQACLPIVCQFICLSVFLGWEHARQWAVWPHLREQEHVS